MERARGRRLISFIVFGGNKIVDNGVQCRVKINLPHKRCLYSVNAEEAGEVSSQLGRLQNWWYAERYPLESRRF
jgi:hypothetical protein